MDNKEFQKIFKEFQRNKIEEGTIENEIWELISKDFPLAKEWDMELLSVSSYVGAINYVILKNKEVFNIIKEQEKFYNGEKFILKLFKIFEILSDINTYTLQNLYNSIMNIELSLSKFIILKLNINNILITKLCNNFNYNANQKIQNLINKGDDKNIFLFNNKVMNNLYFNEKISILKELFDKNYFEVEEMSEIFSIQKINQLKKVKYKDSNNKNKDVFNEILSILNITRGVRNSISHNDFLMINKKHISDLNKSILEIEDFKRNKELIKKGEEIYLYIINKINNFKYNESMRGLYQSIIKEYKPKNQT